MVPLWLCRNDVLRHSVHLLFVLLREQLSFITDPEDDFASVRGLVDHFVNFELSILEFSDLLLIRLGVRIT